MGASVPSKSVTNARLPGLACETREGYLPRMIRQLAWSDGPTGAGFG